MLINCNTTNNIICCIQPDEFASDVGSVLGLWMGISAVTVVEVTEFLLDMLLLGVRKACRRAL